MKWLWIPGILAGLLLLLCLTRVGVQTAFGAEGFALRIKFGWFRFGIFPKKERKKTGASTDKKEKRPAKAASKKTPGMPKPTLADIKDAAKMLLPPLKRALGRTRRGIRIDPLRVSLTLGGSEDPASTAELYGYLQAGMWTVMPELEHLLDIPNPRLHIGMDFQSDRHIIEIEAGISIRIGTLLAVGITVGIPALRWFLRYRNKKKQQPPASEIEAAGA